MDERIEKHRVFAAYSATQFTITCTERPVVLAERMASMLSKKWCLDD